MSKLSINHLSKTYPGQHSRVLKDLSLQLNPGEILALLGESGCGKTTLLRIIAGFLDPDQGEIAFNQKVLVNRKVNLVPEKRNIGFVFQDFALFPHLSVEQNVAYGLHGLSKQKRQAKVQEMLALVEMEHLGHRHPFELSGGQQQRVALARSLAPHPELILMDEPFNNLDIKIKEQTLRFVKNLLHNLKTPAILVSHDFREAAALADRIAVMDSGEIVQLASVEELKAHPANEFVRTLLGSGNSNGS